KLPLPVLFPEREPRIRELINSHGVHATWNSTDCQSRSRGAHSLQLVDRHVAFVVRWHFLALRELHLPIAFLSEAARELNGRHCQRALFIPLRPSGSVAAVGRRRHEVKPVGG